MSVCVRARARLGMCLKTRFGGDIRMPEEFDRKSTGKSGSDDGRIPESKARDGKMLTEREPWNGGMVPEREARRRPFVASASKSCMHFLCVCVCVCARMRARVHECECVCVCVCSRGSA